MTSAPSSPDGAVPAVSPGTEANGAKGRFRAPHRREASGARLREKAAILGYRAGTAVIGRLPFGPTVRAGSLVADAAYVLWPEKRRFVRANAARILDVPAGDRRAGVLARAVFRNQVRWVIEGMRLIRQSNAEHVAQFDATAADRFHEAWLAARGLIIVGLHLGNGEAAAAALAGRGWPVHVVADDTAYEELFERMAAQRRAWGVEVIRWRNLRRVYEVLRAGEILALLVDWGYRPDAQPVRFLGAWTTLPAGPAVLAARTGASIVPFWTRRLPDGTFDGDFAAPIVAASSEPAEVARVTQAIADALEAGVRSIPDQWCVFKPMWPDDPAEEAALGARAAAARAPSGGPAAAREPAPGARAQREAGRRVPTPEAAG